MSTFADKIAKFSEATHSPQRKQASGSAGVQRIAPSSLRVSQLRTLQDAITQSPRVQGMTRLRDALHDGRPLQRKSAETLAQGNRTGLPHGLKTGIEQLSGLSMDNVKVHYNSSRPAQLNALAYAQGTDIHIAPGQERQLPHEAWHVVQQAQGRVTPTMQLAGTVAINDDERLEKEADRMGAMALQRKAIAPIQTAGGAVAPSSTVQCNFKSEEEAIIHFEDRLLDDLGGNTAEVSRLLQLADTRGWDDLRERITFYLGEHQRRSGGGETELRARLAGLDKTDLANLPELLTLLEQTQKNDWPDLEEEILPFVRKLEDARDTPFLIDKVDGEERIFHPRDLREMPLNEVFAQMLLSADKKIDPQVYFNIVERAHNPDEPNSFVKAQVEYQNLLTAVLGLDTSHIMAFNRSAGFEYEFSQFYEKGKLETVGSEEELLRSHVLLAKSEVTGDVFKLPFSLETDSRNALEMVTPPFIFLISKETGTILKRTHDQYEKSIMLLKNELDSPADSPIKGHLTALPKLGFGNGWSWVYEGPELSASSKSAKHATYLGQINVSLDPDEIIALTSAMIEKESKPPDFSLQFATPSQTKKLFTPIYNAIQEGAPPQLGGVLGFYARSASNILGIPSILYRSTFKERPEAGNYATEIKETLGLWVKDFPYLVIADYLATKAPELVKAFASTIERTADGVGKMILREVDDNIKELKDYHLGKIQAFYAKEKRAERLQSIKADWIKGGMSQAQANKDIVLRMKNWEIEGKQAVEEAGNAFSAAALQFEARAKEEYGAMVKSLLEAVGGKMTKGPQVPGRNETEVFGGGLGVRKETFLPPLPGPRKLRVTEIRSSRDLHELEGVLTRI